MSTTTKLMKAGIFKKRDAPIFLLRDEFNTTLPAPLPSVRFCEPGPGVMTKVVDVNNKMDILSGNLRSIVISPTAPTAHYIFSSQTRSLGRTLYVDIRLDADSVFGFSASNSSQSAFFVTGFQGRLVKNSGDSVQSDVGMYTNGEYVKTIIVFRTNGAFVLSKSGVDWKTIFIFNQGSTAVNYPMFVCSSYLAVPYNYMNSMKIFDMGGPWLSEYGIAKNRVATANINDSTSSDSNAIIEMTWTAVTGQTWELSTRGTDASNKWIIRCNQGTSTIKLIELNAGVETERASTSQTWTNGTSYRLVIIQDGNSIKTFVNSLLKNNYASASFNNTATIITTDRAGTNLIAWPRVLSGSALAEVIRYVDF